MVRATYDNVIVGDRLLTRSLGANHYDTVVRKYHAGSKALVLQCSVGSSTPEIVIFADEVAEGWTFHIPLGPPKPITDDRRAMEYGPYSVFSIERQIDGKFLNEEFIYHHDCRQCDSNYRHLTAVGDDGKPVFWGYVPHRASAHCKSGKRPHCTCDTCF